VSVDKGVQVLNLRDYQEKALEQLRLGFLQGKRAQVLVSPTGSGKTEMAIALLAATKSKGNKAAMLLDRIVLCDQTSKRLERYNIDHGVLQSGHWRYRPYENIQVCSAQTLERRGEFPGLSLLIVDECHATREQTVEFIKNNPDVRVVGLTATPFTKGLGKIYDNVVSPVTTKELVERQMLVPLRVFIAKEIDMAGAKKVAGEWSNAEATTRGMKITGDVVAEWVAKTHEIFGEPRKTIVFSAGVDHGADLAQKFQEHGYNFISLSYKDDDQWKKEVIEDFSKPDTKIQGLIATDILTKGFDVPDVMIGVSARPFSKSLSSHIQQMGRVMRGCEGKQFALWLDHSGNYLRFREDWDEVYEDGVEVLDEGKEKAKKEPTEREKKESKCPACRALWVGGSDTCYNCGHVRERQNKVSAVAGKMEELALATMSRENKQEFWSMMQYYVRNEGWSSGRAANTYRDKFGVWPRGLNDNQIMLPSPEVKKFIRSKLHAFLKRIGKR
jgi:superfamily II DNA or RNA helicase